MGRVLAYNVHSLEADSDHGLNSTLEELEAQAAGTRLRDRHVSTAAATAAHGHQTPKGLYAVQYVSQAKR
ncbi:hypothetical protein EIP86_011075 [Pleurotus ostreatoroseus]|nr:hypothetical protein EIP86_008888 [Pleurotus ostreatoroseus]KAF7799833.1 hypothetical protein EIP86_011075 [Pleurotus ostreatoroseus]